MCVCGGGRINECLKWIDKGKHLNAKVKKKKEDNRKVTIISHLIKYFYNLQKEAGRINAKKKREREYIYSVIPYSQFFFQLWECGTLVSISPSPLTFSFIG